MARRSRIDSSFVVGSYHGRGASTELYNVCHNSADGASLLTASSSRVVVAVLRVIPAQCMSVSVILLWAFAGEGA